MAFEREYRIPPVFGVSLSSDMQVDLWQEGKGGNEVSFLPVFDGGRRSLLLKYSSGFHVLS